MQVRMRPHPQGRERILESPFGKRDKILDTFAQGRQRQPQYAQPVEEVSAEAAIPHALVEVEEVTNPAEKLAPFRVAEVLTAERHPQADKLQVLSVDAGDGPMQVVCGAPNARAGMKGEAHEALTLASGLATDAAVRH